MAKKQNTGQRAQVKDLPKKETKLSTRDMKKVKGGASDYLLELDGIKGKKPPATIK